jgi:hypothetical protein
LNLAHLFVAAGASWRRERALLLPVAGLFHFLPALALLLLLPQGPVTNGGNDEAALDLLLAYAREHAGAILAVNLVQLAGAAILLVLCLAPGRPSLGEAMRIALQRLPVFVAAALLTWAALMAGALLILPALYLIGRLFLVGAAIGGEGRGPVAAIVRSVELTHRRGWACFVAAALPFLAGQVVVSIAGGIDSAFAAAGAESGVVHIVFSAFAAAGATAAWLVALLLKIALYRRLTSGT